MKLARENQTGQRIYTSYIMRTDSRDRFRTLLEQRFTLNTLLLCWKRPGGLTPSLQIVHFVGVLLAEDDD